MNDYQYDYEWDDSYCYPNSFVLRNHLGVVSKEALNAAEREITSIRMGELSVYPVKGNFNLQHLQEIHRFLFQDIYPWAGQLRTVNIAKGNQFCNCMYIESGSQPIFDKLKKESYLIGTPGNKICEKLAYYLAEINVIHPFREGNGRAQRVFIESLAQVAGYRVNFTDVSAQEMIEASALSFDCDYQKMESIFERITTPISCEEQEIYIENIAPPGSDILDLYQSLSTAEPELEEAPEIRLE